MSPETRDPAPAPAHADVRRTVRWPAALTRRGLPRNSPVVALAVLGTVDILLWLAAWGLAALVAPHDLDGYLLAYVLVTIVVQIVAGSLLGIYRHRDPVGSVAELRALTLTVIVVFVLVEILALVLDHHLVSSFVIVALLLALVLMIFFRQAARLRFDYERRPRDAEPVVIVGAGVLGTALADQMLRDPASPYLPVAFVDDDPAKRHFRFSGVQVRGEAEELSRVIASTGATGAVVAIGQASPDLFATLSDQLADRDAWLRTIPSVSEMLGQPLGIASIRDIDVSDLIGRTVTRPDHTFAASLIRGRRVLVTGAGGSIGSELSRQIHALEPSSLVMLDRDESALHALSMSLYGRALLDTSEFVLADIRDTPALDAAFTLHRPQIVFHAAALKHLPMLERYPEEAWKSNVHGTRNVIDVARTHDVEHFVNISTDKAARPTSVLGLSKRVAEGLTTAAADDTGRAYVSVRFGNVIGSRGSAIPLFAEQIRTGGPVTVTHPDATRYFMTIPEACELVLFAVAVGAPGETLVLDMGSPVRISDIVQRMMTLYNRRCPVVYTGLRPGEKLDEELFTPSEQEVVRTSDRVSHVRNAGILEAELPTTSAQLTDIDAFYAAVLAADDPSHAGSGGTGAPSVPVGSSSPEIVSEHVPGALPGPEVALTGASAPDTVRLAAAAISPIPPEKVETP